MVSENKESVQDTVKETGSRIIQRIRTEHPNWDVKKASKILEEFYKEKSNLDSIESQKQMLRQVYKIMDWIGLRDRYGDKAWRDLKAEMAEREFSKTYRRYNYYTLKALAKVTNSELTEEPPDKAMKREKKKTKVSTKTLKEAIRRKGMFPEKHKEKYEFCLALASVYGFRQVEIRELEYEKSNREAYIDPDNHIIFVETAKKNPDKHHLIPEPVRDPIETFKRKGKIGSELPRSKAGMQDIFHNIFDPVNPKIANSTGVHEEGPGPFGWHSIRRRLVTSLGMIEDDNGDLVFKESEIRRFMRWSSPDKSMYSDYFTPPKEWQQERDIKLDRKIFEHHPFLEYWRG